LAGIGIYRKISDHCFGACSVAIAQISGSYTGLHQGEDHGARRAAGAQNENSFAGN
jgi:hypothetical protein